MQTRIQRNRRKTLGATIALMVLGAFLGVAAAQARGANLSPTTYFGGSQNLNDLVISWNGSDDDANLAMVSLSVLSHTHAITGVSSQFYTNPNDPSEGHILLVVSGMKNSTLSVANGSMSSSISLGGVQINQDDGVGSGIDHLGFSPNDPWMYNNAFASVQIYPIDLQNGSVNYYEFPPKPGQPIGWQVTLQAYLSFGPGEAGDALGRPFVQSVPTPGAVGLIGLVGLALLRKRNR